MSSPRPVAVAILSVALLVGACSSDDGAAPSGGPGTTADEATTTTAPGETSTTSGPASTEAGPTSAPPAPGALERLLTPVAELGEGFLADPSLGDGSFSPDLCAEVSVEETYQAQSSQALTRADPAQTVSLTEAVLAFPDPASAERFVDDFVAGIQECQEGIDVEDVPVVRDQALRLTFAAGGASSTAAFVRVGSRVAALVSLLQGEAVTPLDDAQLSRIALRLAS